MTENRPTKPIAADPSSTSSRAATDELGRCAQCHGDLGWREYDDELNVYWIPCPACTPNERPVLDDE